MADLKTQLKSEDKDDNIKLDFISKENEDTFVYADLRRITQVVFNLLSNAIRLLKRDLLQ